MDLTTILGFAAALIIGMIMGLIGGGGSILAVPVFVYLMGINPVLATAYSLFVVGATALVGAVNNMLKGQVDFRTAIVFAIPAFIAVYATRRYLIPAIPETLFFVGDFEVTRDIGIMVFFAMIMLLAAISMIRSNGKEQEELPADSTPQFKYPLIVLEGLLVGVATGIVGAGGGFLIIPALVLLAKLPMKKAVATSLLIIAIKSLIGFLGDIGNLQMDWIFLLGFTLIAVLGIFIGVRLTNYIPGSRLKKAFGWFVLLMGIYIIYMELG